MQQQTVWTVGVLNKPSSQNTPLNFRCDHLSAGINRLLGNNTYEAAFPPHEVTSICFLCLSECPASFQAKQKRTRKNSPCLPLVVCLTRAVTRADTPSRRTAPRTTGTYCMSAGLAGDYGTNTSRWISSGNCAQPAACLSILGAPCEARDGGNIQGVQITAEIISRILGLEGFRMKRPSLALAWSLMSIRNGFLDACCQTL